MASTLETILDALCERLEARLCARVERGSAIPTDVPDEGLVMVMDGEPGEPEVSLSPLAYHYEHTAALAVYVAGSPSTPGDPFISRQSAIDARFDAIKVGIGSVLAEDTTLGGLCDWIEPQAPDTDVLPLEGAADSKAALIPVTIYFVTGNPLH